MVSVAEVPGTGWKVVVGRPAAALNAQVRDSMLSIGLAGVLCAVLATGAALWLARYLGRQLRQVVDAHVAGREAPVAGAVIREVVELAQALGRARAAEALSARALQDAAKARWPS